MKSPYFTKLVLIMLIAGILCPARGTTALEHSLPFCPGERMVFRVKWAFIPAGEAVLEVLPIERMNGADAFHFLFTARTNEFVDLIYKVRDRIESYTDIRMTHALRYRKRHEGRSLKDVAVDFDWTLSQAQYSNFGEKRDPVALMPGTFDPLSVFYSLRLNDPKVLKEVSMPVTDGKRCIMGRARVIRREQVSASGISYDTFLVEPELGDLGGLFKKSKNARVRIWVTADHRRLPVMIKSRLSVGNFVAELTSFETGCAASGHEEEGEGPPGLRD